LKQVRKPSVVPIYGIGATWLLCALRLGLYKPIHYISCIVMSCAVYFILRKLFPGKVVQVEEPEPEPQTGNAERDEMIVQGREQLRKIRSLNEQIPDETISQKLSKIELLTNRILKQAEQDEKKLKQVRQFMSYFLPTTVKLLQQYVELQNQGIQGENIRNGMQKVEQLLDTIIVAFQKQLDSLFESQVVDITADIQVMENMMASQGLTNDKDF